jgi:hypothetical protein
VTAKSAGGNSDVIYNPEQQANLIQQYRSPSIAHLATLNDLLNLSTGGIENIIGATSRADQGAVAGMNADAQTKNQTYQDLLTELSKKAEEAYQNKSLALEQQKIDLSGAGGVTAVQAQNLNSDLQNGMQLRDALSKYAGKLSPDDIYAAYNNRNYTDANGTVHGYGTAQESPDILSSLGITKGAAGSVKYAPNGTSLTTGERDNVKNLVDEYVNKWNTTNIGQRLNPTDPDTVYLTNLRTNLVATLRKAMVGGRATQQELQWIMNELPPVGSSYVSNPLNVMYGKEAATSAQQSIYDSFGLDSSGNNVWQ